MVIQNAPRKSKSFEEAEVHCTRILPLAIPDCKGGWPIPSSGSATRREDGQPTVGGSKSLEPTVASRASAHEPSAIIVVIASLRAVGTGLVALLQADAVVLVGEALSGDLELTRVLRGVAGQDDVIGGDRVDGPGDQVRDALGVGAGLLQRDVRGVGVLDLLGGGGPGHRAEDPPRHRVRTGDVGVRLHQQVLVRDEVRPGEVDLLLAGVGDRVGRDDVVDGPVGDRILTLGGLRLHEGDAGLLDAHLLGDVLGHLDVEPGERAVRVLQAQARLVVLDADGQRAGGGLVQQRPAGGGGAVRGTGVSTGRCRAGTGRGARARGGAAGRAAGVVLPQADRARPAASRPATAGPSFRNFMQYLLVCGAGPSRWVVQARWSGWFSG